MRKRLLCLLMAFALLFSGCAQSDAPPQDGSSTGVVTEQNGVSQPTGVAPSGQDAIDPADVVSADPLLESYLTELSAVETPVREYGESTSFTQLEGDLMVRVLYPSGSLPVLDQAVEDWVAETVAYYQGESAGGSVAEDTAELTVEYSSYLVDETLVGVKLTGIYDRPYLAHPIDISASFNASLEIGELLILTDLLLSGGEEALRDMVMEQAGVAAEDLNDGLLDQWLLTPDGLEITLIRGEYLPMSAGTMTLLFSYEELNGIFAIPERGGQEPGQDDVPQDETPPETFGNTLPATSLDPTKPMLALTFDDGPSAHTERLLDVFAAHGGKGTFYVVGNMIDSKPDALRRMASEGHEIGGHSWNHRQLTKLGTQELTDQFMTTRAKIYDLTGVDPTTMRPPYGSYNDTVKAKAAELGISMIYWSVDTLDWKYKDADAVYQAVMDGAKDGAIILCHDLHKTTVDAMERAIPDLIAQGYQLVTVSEMLTCGGEPLTAGTVYFKK